MAYSEKELKTLEDKIHEYCSSIVIAKFDKLIVNNFQRILKEGKNPKYLKVFAVKHLHWYVYNEVTNEGNYIWGDPETGAIYRDKMKLGE